MLHAELKKNIFLKNRLSILHVLFVNIMAGQMKFLIGQSYLVQRLYGWLVSCARGHSVEF
jgi:hypothetical protein